MPVNDFNAEKRNRTRHKKKKKKNGNGIKRDEMKQMKIEGKKEKYKAVEMNANESTILAKVFMHQHENKICIIIYYL